MAAAAPARAWQNRIVEQGEIDPRKLTANPANWRKHPDLQKKVLVTALSRVGWVVGVLVNDRRPDEGWAPDETGLYLIDGHERVEDAIKHDQEAIPHTLVRLSPTEERLVLRTLDAITGLAETDEIALAELTNRLAEEVDDGATLAMLAALDDAQGLELDGEDGEGGGEPGPIDPDAEPDPSKAEELRRKWGVEAGQLWRIPSSRPGISHVVLCGDAKDPAAWSRLMRGQHADLLWTDPPYGVSYQVNLSENDAHSRRRRTDGAEVAGDQLDEGDLRALVLAAFAHFDAHSHPSAPFYVCHPPGALHLVFASAIAEAGWRLHQTLVWVKDAFVMGRSDYHYRHEPIYYGWTAGRVPGGSHRWAKNLNTGGSNSRWYGGDDQESVFFVDRPKRSEAHPTMKPPALVQPHVENSSPRGGIVVDPFCGSGPVLEACETTGRAACLMDVDPGNVAVTLERASLLGLEPVLADEGQASDAA